MLGKLILTILFGLAISAAIADDNIDRSGNIDTTDSSEVKRKKAPDRSQIVENVLFEEHVLFDRTFSMELGYSYAHFDRSELILRGFLALDAIFLGELSVDEIEGDIITTTLTSRWTATFNLGVTYGLTENLAMVTSLGLGLTGDTSDFTFGVTFPYRF